jgi:putative redox protein
MVTVSWVGNLAFEVSPPSGIKFVVDSHAELGGTGRGPTPIEAFLGALASCSAIDVISILRKKQQKVTTYRIEIDGERPPPGEFPRPFTSIIVRHIVTGENIDPKAVERAIELTDQKYCSVIATVRSAPPITSVYEIEQPVLEHTADQAPSALTT